ncbi:MAG: hypothetical protein LBL67_02355, partial [Coriobacteriales bacterium]|nr:hypothetical protein [Coriobacteriales bacterium]
PSAELYPGQTDQDSLPPYAVLDPILRLYVEDGDAPAAARAAEAAGLPQGLLAEVDAQAFKRAQEPPAAQVSPRSFAVFDAAIAGVARS